MLLAAAKSNPISVFLLPLMFVAMYFLILRPSQRKAKAQRELGKSIDEGDEVMTGSGIYGFVTAIEGDVVWLEIADGVDIRVARAAISKKVPSTVATGPSDTAGDDDDDDGDGAVPDATPGEPASGTPAGDSTS